MVSPVLENRRVESPLSGQQEARCRVTPRSFCFGLVVGLLLVAITPYNDRYVAATYLAGNFFPIGAFGAVLLIVLLINPLFILLDRRSSIYRPAEILTVWAMIAVVSGLPSSGLMRYLVAQIAAPTYFATPSNGWTNLIIIHLPARLIVSDKFAVRTFFEGLGHGESVPWMAWLAPLFWWSLFVALFVWAFFCLSAILRRQWVESERLTFPLVQLPTLLADTPEPGRFANSLVRSKLLWIAVALVTALHTVKGLHHLYPSVPDITTLIGASQLFTAPPFSTLNLEVAVYPLVIGFAFLVPTEVTFSLWFFYVLYQAQILCGAVYNISDNQAVQGGISMGPSYTAYQEAGGALALILWLLWSMRRHLGEVWRKAIHNDPAVDDTGEAMTYRAALFGSFGALGGMFLWLTLVADIQPLMSLVVSLGAFVVFVLVSWLVAQAGILFVQQPFLPSQLAVVAAGPEHFSAPTLAMASMTEHVGWYDARELMMPSIMNSYKGASETGLSMRSLTRSLAVGIVLAFLVSAVTCIWLPYTHGGGNRMDTWGYVQAPQIPLDWTQAVAQSVHGPQSDALWNMAGGAVFVLALFAGRAALPAFGLHPAGFLIADTYPMYAIWFSVLLAWLFKTPTMRYGGISGYRKILPFFIGLIVADCLNALVWVVVGLVTHTGYQLLPG